MGLSELETFVRVAETGSLAAAARLLAVPTSTVSRRLSRLEEEYGEQLVLRTARTLRLTDAGAAVFERCAQPLRDIEDVARALRDHDAEPQGELRVTAPADLGSTGGFVRLIAEYRARYPRVRVVVDLSDRTVDLVAERVDVALRVHLSPLPDRSSLMARRLGAIHGGLFASEAYVAARGLPATPDDLAAHACVTTTRGRGLRSWMLAPRAGGPAVEVPIQPCIVANDMKFIRSAVEAGAGIGPMPEMFGGPGLVRVLPDWLAPGATLSMVWPAARSLSPRVRAFLDLMPQFVTPDSGPG